MPPEGPGTPQADIYSLGKVLYEISMGKDRLDFPEVGHRPGSAAGQAATARTQYRSCSKPARRSRQNVIAPRTKCATTSRGWRTGSRRNASRGPWIAGIAAMLVLLLGVSLFAALASIENSARRTARLRHGYDHDGTGRRDDFARRSHETIARAVRRNRSREIFAPRHAPGFRSDRDARGIEAAAKRWCCRRFNFSAAKARSRSRRSRTGSNLNCRARAKRRSVRTTPTTIDLPTGVYDAVAKRGEWELRDRIEIKRGEVGAEAFRFRHGQDRGQQRAAGRGDCGRWKSARGLTTDAGIARDHASFQCALSRLADGGARRGGGEKSGGERVV